MSDKYAWKKYYASLIFQIYILSFYVYSTEKLFHTPHSRYTPSSSPIVVNRRNSSTTTTIQLSHSMYMKIAYNLAKTALGKTKPNPTVGCLLVNKNGVIVGKGLHIKAGKDHAEVMAIKQAGKRLTQGSTAYVTLEPCNHYGRTPPCTLALLK